MACQIDRGKTFHHLLPIGPASAQQTSSNVDVDILLNFYGQDGDHSPVTGGLGTEQLTVFGGVAGVNWTPNSAWWRTKDVADPTNANDFYITDFSSREKPGQDLDVAAPGNSEVMRAKLDVMSDRPLAKRLWKCVTCFNKRHGSWAMPSLFWVAFTDVYVSLVARGVITDYRIF